MRNSYGKMAVASLDAKLGLLDKTNRGERFNRRWSDPEIERERASLISILQEMAKRPASPGIAGMLDEIIEEIIKFFSRGKPASQTRVP